MSLFIPLVMKLFTSVANDFQKISKHNYRIGRNRAVNIRAVARSFSSVKSFIKYDGCIFGKECCMLIMPSINF